MSDIKEDHAKAQALLATARRRWEESIEECTAFDAAAVAAKHLLDVLRSKKGKKNKKLVDEISETQANYDMTLAAFEDSEDRVKRAEQALASAKASATKVQRVYDAYMVKERKWAEGAKQRAAEAEASKKREEARRKRYEEEWKQAEEEQRRAENEQRRDEDQQKGSRDQRKREQSQKQKPQGEQKSQGEQNGSKRKREEEPKRPDPPKAPKVVVARPILAKEKQDWLEACATAFADKPKMKDFPEPPMQPCRSQGCALEAPERALKACKCNIREVFFGRPRGTLKLDRLKFHPDRFSSCSDDVRASVQQKAKEVFVVVDGMFTSG